MKTEIRNNGKTDYIVIIADEGKVLRRIGTDEIFGTEISLGYSYYINGELLPEPHKDVPEDFEEIDNDEDTPEDNDL